MHDTCGTRRCTILVASVCHTSITHGYSLTLSSPSKLERQGQPSRVRTNCERGGEERRERRDEVMSGPVYHINPIHLLIGTCGTRGNPP